MPAHNKLSADVHNFAHEMRCIAGIFLPFSNLKNIINSGRKTYAKADIYGKMWLITFQNGH